MKASIIPAPRARNRERRIGPFTRWAAAALESRLERLREGGLTIVDRSRVKRFGNPDGLHAAIYVRDPAFYLDVALGGSLGAAESYIAGRWNCDDLTGLFRVFARDAEANRGLERGWARAAAPLAGALHRLSANTRRGSARNIQAHYDLGNDFFELLLDPTMNYSCGVFETPETTLEEASRAKMERVCRRLELRSDDHLLEIGTGWGSLAVYAAEHYGCRVTTTTISREQHRRAVARVAAADLADCVTVLLSDYRDLVGVYDKIISVEMIEAVGHDFLPAFFERCGRLLKPDGLLLLQAITMPDDRYEDYRRSVDFIQRYVFPGSCLPSVTALCAAASRSSDLRPCGLEDLTPHYAETLRRWRENFDQALPAVRRLGYSDAFIRLWRYYLAYCEAGFEEGVVGDVHLLFAKPRRRRETLRR